jgi:transcriptional regulator with PAS, ATPase and Fis domain
LITGETGTGKGMLAKWIHRNSERAGYELVEVNCSALQGDLLARELFGNVRGAFTSADKDRKGLLDVADRGTLFLDELGDMGLSLQAQFLKVLEEKSYRRLGDVKLLKSDFRLICATNRDLDEMVREGSFRQDLVYRVNLMSIHLPPLRERAEDIPGLAAHLLATLDAACRELSPEVLALLTGYDWLGNIRELRNVLERALLLARGGKLEPRHFLGLGKGAHPPKPQLASGVNVHQAVDAHVLAVVNSLGGDVDAAASQLGISRATIYRKLKKLKG